MTLDGSEVDHRLILGYGEAIAMYSSTAYAGAQIVWMSCVTYLFAPVMLLGFVISVLSFRRIFQLLRGPL